MKKKRTVLIIGGAVILLLCLCISVAALLSPDKDEKVSQAEGVTESANTKPAATEEISQVLVESTSAPTELPTSTATATVTTTVTPTPTETTLPATQTAVALAQKQTAAAEARSATQTEVAYKATATRAAYAEMATATMQAIFAHKTQVAMYKQIYWKELINYPDNHKGELITFRGRVFNINSDTEFQAYLAGTYEAVYVITDKSFTGLYEDDVITVYGEVAGENCGTNAFGGEICQPLIIDAWIEK